MRGGPVAGLMLLGVVIAGCATITPGPDLAQARAKLVGLPSARIMACMGTPGVQSQLVAGGPVTWLYSYAAGNQPIITPGDSTSALPDYTPFGVGPTGSGAGSALFQSSLATPAKALCNVRFVMDQGVVVEADYVGPDGSLQPNSPLCASLVQPCMR